MHQLESIFMPQSTGSSKGRVLCRNCNNLKTTSLEEESSAKLGKSALYYCEAREAGLKSAEPEASVSPMPGILGVLAGYQVLVTGVNPWEASFICPNPNVKKSANR